MIYIVKTSQHNEDIIMGKFATGKEGITEIASQYIKELYDVSDIAGKIDMSKGELELYDNDGHTFHFWFNEMYQVNKR